MIASRLNVYLDTYNLVKHLVTVQAQFSKQFKYTLGATMQQKAIDLFEYIQLANMFRENRTQYLNGFIVKFESVKTLYRLACEMRQIPIRRQAEIITLMEAIGRQITAWKNSPRRQAPGGTTPGSAAGR